MIKEHDCVVLTKNVSTEGLETGDVGTVVHIHKDGTAYEVEFMTLTGQTVAVVTLLAGDVRPLSRRDLAHARELQTV
ncbi:MAG: DUF4926 domain-containing protein [Verrucomicrobiota bacterium]|nr:DUF4926 domain-containing protein [Chthoniobacterales bacterium]MDQ3413549.1 DUF4926 domain-containing protein [Verrucomicrobiota bacterium]